ncbi:MAG: hypothetical protein D6730_08570 [Bacteroidetes bacterium]|nr:MAG: hypothetical protein D6730_08570 [Bacteroidota bacterium]
MKKLLKRATQELRIINFQLKKNSIFVVLTALHLLLIGQEGKHTAWASMEGQIDTSLLIIQHINYDKAADQPLSIHMDEGLYGAERGAEAATARYEVADSKEFNIEPVDQVFEIGKKTTFEGLRTAHVAGQGMMMLTEDNLEPLLYLRFQKILSSDVQIKVYAENGQLLYSKQAKNLYMGTEFVLNHQRWPYGTHTLQIRLSNGKTWSKKIKKAAPLVSSDH